MNLFNNPAALELGNLRLDVVAHEIELRGARRLGRMDRHLGRRQLEDQPPTAGVDEGKTEDVAQERPVGLGVGAVEDDVRSADHAHTVWPVARSRPG